MMIFGSLSKVNLSTVNWTFWFSILLTKCIVFFFVLIVHAFSNWGQPIGASGLYGIFVTQSNDFALGLPILNALFATSHPEYIDYLFLLAPISLAILNPIGLVLMEISNRKQTPEVEIHRPANGLSKDSIMVNDDSPIDSGNEGSESENGVNPKKEHLKEVTNQIEDNGLTKKDGSNTLVNQQYGTFDTDIDKGTGQVEESSDFKDNKETILKTVLSITAGIFFNPTIIFTIAGLICGTFIFDFVDNVVIVPEVVENFVGTLGNSFTSLALFTLGLAMVGKMERFKEGSNLILPLMLVTMKTIIMPIIAFGATTLLNPGNSKNETSEWADFAFIYGTFPTAPTVYVFAAKYDIAPDLMASSMVVCTVVSAPLTLVSGNIFRYKAFRCQAIRLG